MSMSRVEDVARVLGGERVLGKTLHSPIELVALVREGLPYEAFEAVMNVVDVSVATVASSLRFLLRTLARRKASQRLSAEESERVVRLATLFVQAMAIVASGPVARAWITAENRALGGVAPITLLDTDVGALAATDVLRRIEYGVCS